MGLEVYTEIATDMEQWVRTGMALVLKANSLD